MRPTRRFTWWRRRRGSTAIGRPRIGMLAGRRRWWTNKSGHACAEKLTKPTPPSPRRLVIARSGRTLTLAAPSARSRTRPIISARSGRSCGRFEKHDRERTMEVAKSNAKTPGDAFLQSSAAILRTCLHKIRHCLDQLSDEQVWQRPRPEMNSIANLLIHLTGNLRQWILGGAGGEPDTRNRPAEFTDRSMRSKSELLAALSAVIAE